MKALQYCNDRNALTVGVTNVVGSPVSLLTKCGCHMRAGTEIGVASTKAYTNQILSLILMSCMLGADFHSNTEKINCVRLMPSDIFAHHIMIYVIFCQIFRAIKCLPDQLRRTLQLRQKVSDLSDVLLNKLPRGPMILIGRGYSHATCLEGALKIKHLAHILAEGRL